MSQTKWLFAVVLSLAMIDRGFSDALPGGNPDIIIVDPNNLGISDYPLRIQLLKTLSLGLPNTAGTGFIWTAEVDNQHIATLSKAKPIAVNKGNEPVVGYRILDVFVIVPGSLGSTSIGFKLERPDGRQVSSFNISVIVDP